MILWFVWHIFCLWFDGNSHLIPSTCHPLQIANKINKRKSGMVIWNIEMKKEIKKQCFSHSLKWMFWMHTHIVLKYLIQTQSGLEHRVVMSFLLCILWDFNRAPCISKNAFYRAKIPAQFVTTHVSVLLVFFFSSSSLYRYFHTCCAIVFAHQNKVKIVTFNLLTISESCFKPHFNFVINVEYEFSDGNFVLTSGNCVALAVDTTTSITIAAADADAAIAVISYFWTLVESETDNLGQWCFCCQPKMNTIL